MYVFIFALFIGFIETHFFTYFIYLYTTFDTNMQLEVLHIAKNNTH